MVIVLDIYAYSCNNLHLSSASHLGKLYKAPAQSYLLLKVIALKIFVGQPTIILHEEYRMDVLN